MSGTALALAALAVLLAHGPYEPARQKTSRGPITWAADSPESHVGVGKLKLLCILLAAFGIERAVRRLDILEALSGLRNGSSDSEIIGLSFDHQPVSPGRKHEIGVLWT